eukprot:s3379_g3.t1
MMSGLFMTHPAFLSLRLTWAGSSSGQRQDAADFLQNLYSMLRPLRRSHLVLGGIDLNGRPEFQTPSTTGNLEYGETDQTGRAASDLFQRLQCWLPSTYSRYHPGESRTFCHPTGASHRIDFVVVSGKARIEQVLSEVLLDVDVGSARDDHFPVTDFLQGIMEKHFSRAAPRPMADFIPQQVWQWRQAKQALKTRTWHRVPLWRDLLERAFDQWRTGLDHSVGVLIARQGLLYQISAAIKFVTDRIKKSIRDALATDAGAQDAHWGGRAHDRTEIGRGGSIFGKQECGEVLQLAAFLQSPMEPLIVEEDIN